MFRVPKIEVTTNKNDRCIEARVIMPKSIRMSDEIIGFVGWSVCTNYDTGKRQPSKLLPPTVRFLKSNNLGYLLPPILVSDDTVTIGYEIKLSQLPELEAALFEAAMKKFKENNY